MLLAQVGPCWTEIIGLMNAFFIDKDEDTWDTSVLDFIKPKDPFILIRKTTGGSTMDLSVGQQAVVATKAIGAPLAPR